MIAPALPKRAANCCLALVHPGVPMCPVVSAVAPPDVYSQPIAACGVVPAVHAALSARIAQLAAVPGLASSGVIDAMPCTVTTLVEAAPAVPGALPAIVVVSCAAVTRCEPVPVAPAPASVVTPVTCLGLLLTTD